MFGGDQRSGGGPDYELLPTADGKSTTRVSFGPSRWLKRRRNLAAFVLLVASAALVLFYLLFYQPPPEPVAVEEEGAEQPLPPLYREYRQAELELPQHDHKNPFADGRKYLWVADHVQSSGWGNFMQDLLMNAELVYRSGRSFVFDNYTWDRDGPDYADYNGKKIPSRVPLSALISGPIVGGPFNEGDHVPRAVSKDYWDEICPNPTQIMANEIRDTLPPGMTSEELISAFLDVINGIDDPCLEIYRHSGTVFHVFMFGAPRELLPSWPRLARSPILRLFGWGTPAHTAFDANRQLFSPAPLIEDYVATPACEHCVDPYAPLPGLLALHLRRGDFIEHCPNLGHWGAGFNAFNSFPTFPDPWVPPEGDEDAKMALYLRRCLPSIEQIVEKVEAVRAQASSAGLKNIYIMTNGDRAWLQDLKAALARSFKWEHIATSRDMLLTPEQRYVSQTMDMLIGERAQVFIGNGFSSMTSNIALLRMVREQPPSTTHMW